MPENHSDRARYLDDVDALARMASILSSMVAFGFDPARAQPHAVRGCVSFTFPKNKVEDLLFAAGDVLDRSDSLAKRRHLLEGARDE